jgi:hypothetical protein
VEPEVQRPRQLGSRQLPASDSFVDLTVVANYFPIALLLLLVILIRIVIAIFAAR